MSKAIRKTGRFTIGVVGLVVVGLCLSAVSCEKDENGNRVTYYKTEGEGYIFYRDSNKPIEGIKIIVTSSTGAGWFSMPYTKETFITDKNGYYKIRFAKRVGGYKVERYMVRLDHFSVLSYPPPPALFWEWETSSDKEPLIPPSGYQYPEEIKDKKKNTFDTIKFYYYPAGAGL